MSKLNGTAWKWNGTGTERNLLNGTGRSCMGQTNLNGSDLNGTKRSWTHLTEWNRIHSVPFNPTQVQPVPFSPFSSFGSVQFRIHSFSSLHYGSIQFHSVPFSSLHPVRFSSIQLQSVAFLSIHLHSIHPVLFTRQFHSVPFGSFIPSSSVPFSLI
jgi:hypothetical protein